MTVYVADASVAAKWFLRQEEHAVQSNYLLSARHQLFAPTLLPAEIASVVLRRVRRGELPEGQVARISRVIGLLVNLVPIPGLIAEASRIAVMYGTSVYDALYVALAADMKCAVVTADRRLLDAVRPHLPHAVTWVEDVAAEGR